MTEADGDSVDAVWCALECWVAVVKSRLLSTNKGTTKNDDEGCRAAEEESGLGIEISLSIGQESAAKQIGERANMEMAEVDSRSRHHETRSRANRAEGEVGMMYG